QENIKGIPIKLHFYRKRDGLWLSFMVACESNVIDYRYDEGTIYKELETKLEWILAADLFLKKYGCRFFDVDIITHKNGEVFLEVNFSPAPRFFEEHVGDTKFSSRLLADWLKVCIDK
ncbi:hypothetical protein KA005_14220, partial [bacterium]|nr:hypothetical protein [bacterium]